MRGYSVASYVDDFGAIWRLLVEAEYALDPPRGWATGLEAGLTPLPRQWMPRVVVGLDNTGRKVRTRVASMDADLWTGAETHFFIIANDGVHYWADVIARLDERRRL